MPKIFDYLDYREFLKDYYAEKKAAMPSFSYQIFASRAGFGSKSFLPHVIDGKRDLSRDSIFKIGTALKLDAKSFSYFEDLVGFNQAKSPKQKSHFFARMAAHKQAIKARFIQQNQYEYIATWYHTTIRELVTFADFQGDFAKLAGMVYPPISARQARDSVNLLLNLGLIRKEGEVYLQTNRALTTGDEVASMIVHRFHMENLKLASHALENVPGTERDITCMIVGLSREGFEAMKTRIQAFRKELAELVDKDRKAERVYNVNFQVFPTTRRNGSA